MCGESKKLMNERISGWMIGEWMNERNEWRNENELIANEWTLMSIKINEW